VIKQAIQQPNFVTDIINLIPGGSSFPVVYQILGEEVQEIDNPTITVNAYPSTTV